MKVKSKLGLLALGLALAAGSLAGCKTSSGGGGSGPILYEVNWNKAPSIYTVSGINEEGYKKGATVEFSITLVNPDDYRITTVTSEEADIQNVQDLDYTFVMPKDDVSIRINYAAIDKYAVEIAEGEEVAGGDPVTYRLTYGSQGAVGAFTIEGDTTKVTIDNTLHKVEFLQSGSIPLAFKVNGAVVYNYTANVRVPAEGETRATAITVARALEIGAALPDPSSYTEGIGSTSTDRHYWIKGVITGLYKSDAKGHHFYLDNTKFELYGVKTLPDGVTDPNTLFGANMIMQAKIEKLSFNSGSSFVYENDTFGDGTKVVEIDAETLTGLEQPVLNPAYSLEQATLQLPNIRKPASSKAEIEYVVTGEHATVNSDGLVTFVDAGDVVITATYGSFSSVMSFTIVDGEVGDWYRVKTTPEVGSNYRLVLDRGTAATNPGNWYLDGGTGSADYYLSTSSDSGKALSVSVIDSAEGFKLKVGTKYLFLGTVGTHINSLYKDSESEATVFKFSEALGIPTVEISSKPYWLGNNPDKTFTEAQATNFTQYPNNYKVFLECFGIEPEPPALENLVVAPATATVDVYAGQKTKQFTVSPVPALAELGEIEWSIVEEDAHGVTVDANGLVTVPQNAVEVDATANFTVRATAKGKEIHSDAVLTVKRATPGEGGQGTEDNPYSPAEARAFIDTLTPAGTISENRIYVAGIVASVGTWSSQYENFEIFFQSEDGKDEKYFESYHTKLSGTITYASITAGDYVVVEGLAKVYNGTYELTDDANHANNPTVVSVEDRDPVLLGVKMNKEEATVNVGETLNLSVVPVPSYASTSGTVQWVSSDSTKASVSDAGVVAGKVATEESETVIITATVNGKVAQCNVTVSELDPSKPVTVTISPSDFAAVDGGTSGAAIGGTSGKISITAVGTNTATEFRVFKGKTMNVSVDGGTITSIVITCTANGTTKQGPGCWGAGAPAGYTYETDGKVGTWVGDLASIAFTATDNQVRIVSFVITYKLSA